MSDINSKLILTIKSINYIDSLFLNQVDKCTLVCSTGELKSLSMIEKQVLQLKFSNCELDIDVSITDLLNIRDESGEVLIKGVTK